MNQQAAEVICAPVSETLRAHANWKWIVVAAFVVFSIANSALGYSLQCLAERVADALRRQGMVTVVLTDYAMSVPVILSVFAVIGIFGVATAFFRWTNEKNLACSLVFCLIADIILLYVAAWGFSIQFLPGGIILDPVK